MTSGYVSLDGEAAVDTIRTTLVLPSKLGYGLTIMEPLLSAEFSVELDNSSPFTRQL